MKLFCQWYMVWIALLMSSVIVSQNVDFTGDPKVNGTYGGNVTITWNVTSKHDVDVFLNIFSGDTDDRYILDKKVTASIAQKQTSYFDRSKKTSPPEIVNRVSAIYSSDGKKDSNGMIIGEVLFTIINLKFSDRGMYTIAEGIERIGYDVVNNQTVLSVYSLPHLFGEKTVYGKGFTLSLEFLGKPKPFVTWTLDGSAIASEPGKKIRDHIYKYTVTLDGDTLPEPCEKKNLSYSATNNVGTVTGSTIIQVEPNLSGNFVEDIKFQNYTENSTTSSMKIESGYIECVNITWNKTERLGKCRTHFELKFYDDKDNTDKKQVIRVNTTNTFLNICNRSDIFDSKLYKIVTFVFGSNDTFLKKKESEGHGFNPFNSKPPNNKDNENEDKDKEEQKSPTIIIVIVAVCCSSGIVVVVVVVMRRKKKRKTNSSVLQQEEVENSSRSSPEIGTKSYENDYIDLPQVQGAAAVPIEALYAPVIKNKRKPTPNDTIYSELGPGGGRVGPKPVVQQSNYAEAKDLNIQ